jgi:hypothetical protein
MMLALYPLFSRLRSLLEFMPALVKKLLGMKSRDDEFAPQRMCAHFVDSSPRAANDVALECGKSLKPA